jgi:hypothetical protein
MRILKLGSLQKLYLLRADFSRELLNKRPLLALSCQELGLKLRVFLLALPVGHGKRSQS